MFQAPRSKIQRCVKPSQPFTCCAPPRRNECDVRGSETPATRATRSNRRLTWVTSNSGVDGDKFTAVATGTSGKLSIKATAGAVCVIMAMAIACSGQVTKSASGNSERPCSSEVFMRMKRTKNTLPASTERFCFRTRDRSEARPNRYHSRHSKAASW
ncbi:Hypothetical protein PHPALM_16905 [Phytophthora palmivora]|uniref:Uncharacterized protein n=1 Tax=Phytophthora palmivora TaxID=4796 RepID=A0A2P4XNK4_9STRA|nr:Hypothetical protein PHPALM_16905 [Phytophthora palmivora]